MSKLIVDVCVCGSPSTFGTVHRTDGPCYIAQLSEAAGEPDAEVHVELIKGGLEVSEPIIEFSKTFESRMDAKPGRVFALYAAPPAYDRSVVARIATQMGWTPPDARLADALRDCCERMERARGILTDDNPRPDRNWGMLDTSKARALLKV